MAAELHRRHRQERGSSGSLQSGLERRWGHEEGTMVGQHLYSLRRRKRGNRISVLGSRHGHALYPHGLTSGPPISLEYQSGVPTKVRDRGSHQIGLEAESSFRHGLLLGPRSQASQGTKKQTTMQLLSPF